MEVPMMLVVFVKGGTRLTSQAYAICRYTYLRNLCVCVHRTQLRRIVRSGKAVPLTSVHEGFAIGIHTGTVHHGSFAVDRIWRFHHPLDTKSASMDGSKIWTT